jgi:hypothetical protein
VPKGDRFHTEIAERDFDDDNEELEDDDIVLDAVVLMRVSKPEDFGQGRSALMLFPEKGMDPIVLAGMLHNAMLAHDGHED